MSAGGRFRRRGEEPEEEENGFGGFDDGFDDDFDSDFDNIEQESPNEERMPVHFPDDDDDGLNEPSAPSPSASVFSRSRAVSESQTRSESQPRSTRPAVFRADPVPQREETPTETKDGERTGFVPSIETPDMHRRTRYKKRNKKPLPFWVKATLTGVGLVFGFVAVYGFIFWQIMIGRIGSTDDFVKAKLSAAEAAAIESEKVDEDEVYEADFVVEDTPVVSDKDIQIILVAGTDARPSSGTVSRADTLMLVAVDRKHGKIKMVSIQRDLYAIIPGYKRSKINTAYYYDSASGNSDLRIIKKTLEKNLSITFDDYVILDFSSFATIVDMIGGVTCEVSEDEARYMCSDKKYGLFPRYASGAGTYIMSGKEALNYVRMRKVQGQNDFNRTSRQRKMLSLMLNEIKDLSYVEMAQLMYAIFPYVTTDLSESQMLGFVSEAPNIIGYDIEQLTVPIDGTWKYGKAQISGAQSEVIVCNYTFNAQQLQAFIYNDDMTYANNNKAAEDIKIPSIDNIQNNAKTTKPADTTTTTKKAA